MTLTKCRECNYMKELIKFRIYKHPPKYIRYMDIKQIIKKYDIKWAPLFKNIYICGVFFDGGFINRFFHTIYIYNLLMKQNKLVKVKKNDYDNYYKSYHFDLFVLYHLFYKYRTDNYIHPYLNWLNDFYIIRYNYKNKYILL